MQTHKRSQVLICLSLSLSSCLLFSSLSPLFSLLLTLSQLQYDDVANIFTLKSMCSMNVILDKAPSLTMPAFAYNHFASGRWKKRKAWDFLLPTAMWPSFLYFDACQLVGDRSPTILAKWSASGRSLLADNFGWAVGLWPIGQICWWTVTDGSLTTRWPLTAFVSMSQGFGRTAVVRRF